MKEKRIREKAEKGHSIHAWTEFFQGESRSRWRQAPLNMFGCICPHRIVPTTVSADSISLINQQPQLPSLAFPIQLSHSKSDAGVSDSSCPQRLTKSQNVHPLHEFVVCQSFPTTAVSASASFFPTQHTARGERLTAI
jgi:hypothetical protein